MLYLRFKVKNIYGGICIRENFCPQQTFFYNASFKNGSEL
jgi:hypothetical protein